MQNNLKQKIQKSLKMKAFTLIETMVAISILSLAITGPMLIAQKGIQSSIYARDQIVAFYLAQDAIEFVRQVRDSQRSARISNPSINWLAPFSNPSSDPVHPGCMGVGEKCQIDSRVMDFNATGAIKNCSLDSNSHCPKLTYDSSNHLYGYGVVTTGGPWQNSLYTRDIVITPVDTSDITTAHEAEISVTIFWNTNLFTAARTFTVKEHILNF